MNQADRKEFDLIHNKIDQIKEDIDDLKDTMNKAHTKTEESLSFMKENLFNPRVLLRLDMKFFLQWLEHFMLLQHPALHLSSRKARKYRQVMFCALSKQ